jgi:hypothetical protein
VLVAWGLSLPVAAGEVMGSCGVDCVCEPDGDDAHAGIPSVAAAATALVTSVLLLVVIFIPFER